MTASQSGKKYVCKKQWVKVKSHVSGGRHRHKHASPSSRVTLPAVFSSDASDKMWRAEPTPWWESNKAANTRPNTFSLPLFSIFFSEPSPCKEVRPRTWMLCLLPGKPESCDRKWRKKQWRAQLTRWLGRTQTKTITGQRFRICYDFLSKLWRAFWGGDVAACV